MTPGLRKRRRRWARPALVTRDLDPRRPDPVEEHLPEGRVARLHTLDGDAAEPLERLVLVEGVPEGRDEPGREFMGRPGPPHVPER